MFLRTHTIEDRTYLLLVENERVNGKVTQRLRQRFGRIDYLRESGQLDAIVAGLGRSSERLLVLGRISAARACRARPDALAGRSSSSGCGKTAGSPTCCGRSRRTGISGFRLSGRCG